jgi:nitrate reductase assembly molybdenum cofactor insertion protein NarJ
MGTKRKKIEKLLNNINKEIENELNEIGDEVLEVLMDRAIMDANELFESRENGNLKSTAYVIYRSYVLGMLFEKIKNQYNNDNNDNIDKRIKKIRDNVIHLDI